MPSVLHVLAVTGLRIPITIEYALGPQNVPIQQLLPWDGPGSMGRPFKITNVHLSDNPIELHERLSTHLKSAHDRMDPDLLLAVQEAMSGVGYSGTEGRKTEDGKADHGKADDEAPFGD